MIGTESKRVFTGFSPLGFYYGLPYQPVTAGSNPARSKRRKRCATRKPKKMINEVRKMKNAILKICEKLRGYSETDPYFEVTEVKQNENGTYTVNMQVVDPAEEQGAQNESN